MKEYIEKNKDRFLEELFEWLRIPSVSADPSFSDQVRKAADAAQGEGCSLEPDGIPPNYHHYLNSTRSSRHSNKMLSLF